MITSTISGVTTEVQSSLIGRTCDLKERLCKLEELTRMLKEKLFSQKDEPSRALGLKNEDGSLCGNIENCHGVLSGVEETLSQILERL